MPVTSFPLAVPPLLDHCSTDFDFKRDLDRCKTMESGTGAPAVRYSSDENANQKSPYSMLLLISIIKIIITKIKLRAISSSSRDIDIQSPFTLLYFFHFIKLPQ